MPYWRLSGFYLFFFASLGALIPYWSLYLKSLGYSAQEIGIFMAIIMATKIISPNIWGYIADRTGRRMAIIRLGSLLALICFAGVLIAQTFWWLVVVMVAFSFFWNAALPQFEATTFNHLGKDTHHYSSIRLWGSIGFIITVVLLGPLLDDNGASILPYFLLVLFAGIWLSSLIAPESASNHHSADDVHLWSLLKKPTILALLFVCLFMQMSHGTYYTFYTIYLSESGYTNSVIGQLWALGVIAEVVVFLFMHKLVPKFGLLFLLQLSLALTAIRWLLIGFFVQEVFVLIAAQLLHAASFGVYHAAAIHLIHRFFTGRNQGIGQALYSSLSFGAGGAIGSYISGMTWDVLGPSLTFWIASVIAMVGFVIARIWLNSSHIQA